MEPSAGITADLLADRIYGMLSPLTLSPLSRDSLMILHVSCDGNFSTGHTFTQATRYHPRQQNMARFTLLPAESKPVSLKVVKIVAFGQELPVASDGITCWITVSGHVADDLCNWSLGTAKEPNQATIIAIRDLVNA